MAEVRSAQLVERTGVPTLWGPYRSVLLVEDEATFRRVIARNLSGRGLLVREVGTADEAVAVSTADRPDLMLLDINLPDHSGWDVMRELRQLGIDVPTIVVSAVRVSQIRLEAVWSSGPPATNVEDPLRTKTREPCIATRSRNDLSGAPSAGQIEVRGAARDRGESAELRLGARDGCNHRRGSTRSRRRGRVPLARG